MKTTCLNCKIEFDYLPWQTKGLYCSVACTRKHAHEIHKQNWYNNNLVDKIDRNTIRKILSIDRGYKCEVCGLSEWQNKPITLQVDHINGDSSNDRPDNVRLICPNCHSQTEFLGNANRGRGRKSLGISLR